MSNIAPARVRDRAPDETDPRIARTTHALGRALIELIQERDFDDITVQHILDRADVGRATFYAHYRNKEDALHSSYERVFDALEPLLLARPTSSGPRLFPVAEFLDHIADMRPFVDGLRRANRLDDAWDMLCGYAVRIIERRIASGGWPAAAAGSTIPGSLAARMLAGALMESIKWWQDHPCAATPAEMDAAFHELARAALRGPR
ncbi:MAG TPA: TetR/AcrR family transcriptional regulator [Gemmatimonadaceae bacterium]|nr:TetR/AcrR family transcriptional regulator [Gemmatimonadaceae bacterium]